MDTAADRVRAMIVNGVIADTPSIRRALARGDIDGVMNEHGRLSRLGWGTLQRRAPMRRKSDTRIPQVRMDIQTAVQIASLSDQPLGLVELLTDTAPVHLGEFVGPAEGVFDAVVVDVVDTTRRWRDAMARRVRRAREASRLDKDIARSAAFLARMARDRRITNMLAWACVVIATALVVALDAWLLTRQ